MLEQLIDTLKYHHRQALICIVTLPGWAYIAFYAGLVVLAARFLSKFSFVNVVKTIEPINSIQFSTDEGPISFSELVKQIPEFRTGAWSLMNPFLFHGHLQTMYAGIRRFRFVDRIYFGREILTFDDGAQVSLDRMISKDKFLDGSLKEPQTSVLPKSTRLLTTAERKELDESSKPILLGLHGLSGSSAESYIRCIFSRMPEFECMVLNSRGCGKTVLSTPTLFNGFWTYDVRETIKILRARSPNRKIYAMGFSLGASILANYIGQSGENSGLDLAILLANPWDLSQSSYTMDSDFICTNVYSPIMTVPLKQLLLTNYDKLKEDPNFRKLFAEQFKDVYYLVDFDNAFTSRLFGFNCASEYYRSGSSITKVFNIRTPTLAINSMDDPIVGGCRQTLPIRETLLQPYLVSVCTSLGGHLGWFKWNNERWYAAPLSRFISDFHRRSLGAATVDPAALPWKRKVVDDTLVH